MNIIKSIAIIVGGIIIADIVRDILDSLVEESVTDDYITMSEEDSAAVADLLTRKIYYPIDEEDKIEIESQLQEIYAKYDINH